MRAKIKNFEDEVVKPDFWKDTAVAQKISEELADLKEVVGFFGKTENQITELEEIASLSNIDSDMMKEIEDRAQEIDKKISVEEIKMFLSGKNDKDNALVSIHAGAGGADSQDWSEMLLKMYLKYFENQNFKAKVLSVSQGEEAGIKSVDIEVRGKYVYGYLKNESGVHRLVRLSPFNAQNLRHTSFAKVEVLPVAKNKTEGIVINADDIKIDTFRASGPGGQYVNKTESAVRIHHFPTGIIVSVQSERSQLQNKEKAMELLRFRILQKKEMEIEEKSAEMRATSGKAEWAHQIRSYVLHPYKMIKDHRTKVETSDVDGVLKEGKLDEFVEAELKNNRLLRKL